MADRLTTPAPTVDPFDRRKWRRVVAAMLLAAPAIVFGWWKSTAQDPLAARLLGAWKLESTPSGTSERRSIEFCDDGSSCIYSTGRPDDAETLEWFISRGDLVVVFENPLTQPAPVRDQLLELGRRMFDPANTRRSYRYRVVDDRGRIIRFLLVDERGNPPAAEETFELTREAKQPAVK